MTKREKELAAMSPEERLKEFMKRWEVTMGAGAPCSPFVGGYCEEFLAALRDADRAAGEERRKQDGSRGPTTTEKE